MATLSAYSRCSTGQCNYNLGTVFWRIDLSMSDSLTQLTLIEGHRKTVSVQADGTRLYPEKLTWWYWRISTVYHYRCLVINVMAFYLSSNSSENFIQVQDWLNDILNSTPNVNQKCIYLLTYFKPIISIFVQPKQFYLRQLETFKTKHIDHVYRIVASWSLYRCYRYGMSDKICTRFVVVIYQF